MTRRLNALQQHAIALDERRAEGFMAFAEDREGLGQCGTIQFAAQAHDHRCVVGGAVRLHLPEQPLPLLGVRRDQGLVTRHRCDRLDVLRASAQYLFGKAL
ncbi:hypothetical protein D9M71_308930 [compost metagenome]